MLLDTRILNKLIYQLTLSGTVPPNWLALLSLTLLSLKNICLDGYFQDAPWQTLWRSGS